MRHLGRGALRAAAFAAALLPLALAACDLNMIYGEPNPDADVAGEWALSAWHCCTSSGGTASTASGSLFLTTTGRLSGSAVLEGDSSMTFSGPLVGARKTGADLTFSTSGCQFTGTVRGPAGENLRGTYHCDGGGGDWDASRAMPPVTAAWPLAERTMVTGGALDARVKVTDSRGAWLLRDFAFSSSDPTVARVERHGQYGLITVAGPGTATITATAFDVSVSLTIHGIAPVRFRSVSAGATHTCGVTTDGAALCWGANGRGDLGDASSVYSLSPLVVAGGLSWATVFASYYRTCGLTTAGALYCWGDMDGAPLSVPFYVLDSPAFSTLAVGDQHACAITAAGSAYCWGANESGQLGNGTAARSAQPVAVTGEHTFTAISPGAAHTCALAADSTAWCWGDNRAGQLGSGSTSALAMTTPVAVTGGMKFTAIGAGAAYTCALAAGGAAYCWGDNAFGRLGIGFNDSSAAPVAVAGALRFTALSAELGGPCAIASDGHAYCWGSHHGVSGTEPSSVARQLSFASISAGEDHDCGIATDGIAYCWGTNWYGQLGDGTEVTSAAPVRVVGQR